MTYKFGFLIADTAMQGTKEGETIKSKTSPCLSSELIEEQVKVVRLGQSNTLLLIELLLEHAAFIFREQAF